jgi:RNA polymerase sigma factor (sigma-70 family)
MATTEELIDDLQRGNRQAVEELYRRYALRVLFLVRARMGPALRIKEQSGDLAQEALLKSLHGLDSFVATGDGAFIAYLVKKVEEVICDRVDYWQAGKRDPRRELSIAQVNLERVRTAGRMATEPGPAEILEQHEDIQRLLRALDELRERRHEHWDLLIARRLESRSYEEIAATRDLTPEAVRKKCERATRMLTKIFEKLANDDGTTVHSLRGQFAEAAGGPA